MIKLITILDAETSDRYLLLGIIFGTISITLL